MMALNVTERHDIVKKQTGWLVLSEFEHHS
jgi:hypothetical protein